MIYPVSALEAIYRCEHYDDVEKGAGERLSIKDTGMKGLAFVTANELFNRR